ncbi:hypothetical protein SK1NUM_18240 [Arachnia rubra]|nr:hypothetical protein SK1NUM_18240 [Arachnia rubra]
MPRDDGLFNAATDSFPGDSIHRDVVVVEHDTAHLFPYPGDPQDDQVFEERFSPLPPVLSAQGGYGEALTTDICKMFQK